MIAADSTSDSSSACPDCDGTGFSEVTEPDDDGNVTAVACPTCHVAPTTGPWHVISSEDLRRMLHRVHGGEDPEMVYMEEYVNAERPEGSGQRQAGQPPCDWDGESYCTADGCLRPATHRSLLSLTTDGTPVVELVCCQHATTEQGEPDHG